MNSAGAPFRRFLNDLGGFSQWHPRLEPIVAQLEGMVDDEILASFRAAAADAS